MPAVHAPSRAASHWLLPSGCLPVHQIPAERVLVVYDDLDLATAAVRLRAKGGHGGHNGMKSIAGSCCGAPHFSTCCSANPACAALYICEQLACCCSLRTPCLRCGTTVNCVCESFVIPLPSRARPGPQPTFKALRTSLGCASASAARPAPCPFTPGCCRWAAVAAYC